MTTIFVTRRDLREHFRSPKKWPDNVVFYPAKTLKLPRPLHNLGGSHHCTDLLNLGGSYRIALVWKEAKTWDRRAIYAHFFYQIVENNLYPLADVHYHPGHKGLHILLNCEDQRNLSNRHLAGAKEFNLKLDKPIDPQSDNDRQRFLTTIGKRLGITV